MVCVCHHVVQYQRTLPETPELKFATTVGHGLQCVSILLLQKHNDLSGRNQDCFYFATVIPQHVSISSTSLAWLGLEYFLKILFELMT